MTLPFSASVLLQFGVLPSPTHCHCTVW